MDLARNRSALQFSRCAQDAAGAKLPRPDFLGAAVKNSVFSNPYQEEEQAKQAILEKHVKMVPTKTDTVVINGKKICWNYRKGKCRFGHKCQFAHDSDLQRTEEERNEKAEMVAVSEPKPKKPKKRPGLTQGLAPGKKVMKTFYKQQKQPLC